MSPEHTYSNPKIFSFVAYFPNRINLFNSSPSLSPREKLSSQIMFSGSRLKEISKIDIK
jgi:hypothetical protein